MTTAIEKSFCFNNENTIRVHIENQAPWFHAGDVCETLGYKNVPQTLGDHCKESGISKRYISSGGQGREVNFIDKPNLFRLIMRSKMPAAEKFQDWVVEDVLPSIEKNGMYATDNFLEQAIANPDHMIGLLQQFRDEREQKNRAIAREPAALLVAKEQETVIQAMKPDADYTKAVLNSSDIMTINAVAQDLGLTHHKLYAKLIADKILYKEGKEYRVHAKFRDLGYFKSSTFTYTNNDGVSKTSHCMKVTELGRRFILDRYRQNITILQLPVSIQDILPGI